MPVSSEATPALTVAQAREELLAAGLPISRSALYRLLLTFRIRAYRVHSKVLIPRGELTQFIESCKRGERW